MITASANQTQPSFALIGSSALSIIAFRGSLIKMLIEHGIKVYTLVSDIDEQTRQSIRSLGAIPIDIQMKRTGITPLHDLRSLVKLTILLKKLKPDFIFCYFMKSIIYGLLAGFWSRVTTKVAIIEGVGFVFTENNAFSIKRKMLKILVTQLYRYSLKHADHIFILNPDDRLFLLKKKLATPQQIHQIDGIGLDLMYYAPKKNISEKLTFIMIARLLKEKGVYEYIRAAQQIKKKYPLVHFILLGDIDENPGSIKQEEIVRWVNEQLIEWPGHVNDVRPWLARSSIFVLPSYREGLPRSTQEAMAMGKAVITTLVPGAKETVVHGANGFLIPAQDISALVDAMQAFIKNPSLIKNMGKASRQMAEERFDEYKINSLIIKSIMSK